MHEREVLQAAFQRAFLFFSSTITSLSLIIIYLSTDALLNAMLSLFNIFSSFHDEEDAFLFQRQARLTCFHNGWSCHAVPRRDRLRENVENEMTIGIATLWKKAAMLQRPCHAEETDYRDRSEIFSRFIYMMMPSELTDIDTLHAINKHHNEYLSI